MALKIGQVARSSGVSVDAIRFYERRGVLPEPRRLASGYRVYTEATVTRLRFVKALQALGFQLEEIIEVLEEVDGGNASCRRGQPRFASVLARIDAQIAELQSVRGRLLATLDDCQAGRCSFREELEPG